ncbi:MATE family efflux transporter [Persicirhabdus sediminis]|uniref:Multidrug-efflux transporter n=1 Tax=Persicirhabdus sediminis TaxID=454144 RepID=A0A8J7MCD6_9BACT|nr:MATE family efflux transporter [Persicirhabdus sediminis]MBK1790557.1 MATE family efflux transporter [Persicirhabdus sediminis]
MQKTQSDEPVGRSYWQEAKLTILLALPLIVGQIGQMLIGLADTIMIGKIGVVPLGASTFANTLLMVPLVSSMGLLAAVSIKVAQGRGRKDFAAVREAVRHGSWLACLYFALVFTVVMLLIPRLDLFDQPESVTAITPGYLKLVTWSLLPAMLALGWKYHGDALNHPWPSFWIFISGVFANIVLNWLLIYGNWGFPELGLEGAGWATLISRIYTAVAVFIWINHAPSVKKWAPRKWLRAWHIDEFKSMLHLGVPVALFLMMEVGMFSAGALVIGSLGEVPLAAHQVALTCSGITFMVPLGISMAITVRTGEVTGSGEHQRLKKILVSGWMFGLMSSFVSMAAFLLAGEWIAAQIVEQREVIVLAASLLIVAGVFQIVDGMQVISAAALRGIADVKIPAWMAGLSYWIIGVPVGAFLAKMTDFGAQGMWIGMASGLGVSAICQSVRAWKKF